MTPLGSIEQKHGLDESEDGSPPDGPDGPNGPSGSGPKRRWIASPVVIIALVVAGIAWGIPILQGFHFGCNVLAGDIYRESRLGIEMCRGINQAEVTAAKEKVQHEQEAQANREAEATRTANEQTAQKEHEAQQTKEAERPGLEAAASKLKTEAASWRQKLRLEEGVKKHDESEAERLSNDANRAEGEESDTLNEQSDNYNGDADTAEGNIDSDKYEAENKQSEAEADSKTASED
jgi:hypothetical protein